MRFAGTWKQYSKNAMPQLATMTFHKASLRYFRWPYHAKVMKILEMVRSRTVRTKPPYEFYGNQRRERETTTQGRRAASVCKAEILRHARLARERTKKSDVKGQGD